MGWDLIASIQQETDLRLIAPFGLNLRLGDVISVAKNGDFTLEGSTATVLGMPARKPRPKGKPVGLFRVSGKEVKYNFNASGKASSLFPDLPKANATLDLTFGSARSWLLAMTARR